MGALHQGHMKLVTTAREECDTVVASIFVNPKQFGPNEDFDKYPKSLEKDIAALEDAGCDYLYVPTQDDLYPPQFSTHIHVSDLTDVLCGAKRPGHFDGVALILTKLFNQLKPDVVFMGEKDWQQLTVVKQLIRDLNFSVDIYPVETVRDKDGLALSSRNQYLSRVDRQKAPILYEVLSDVAASRINVDQASQRLLKGGFSRIDYLEIRSSNTLRPINVPSEGARVFGAAYLGETRLIDNVACKP